jgi:hypothetical protein
MNQGEIYVLVFDPDDPQSRSAYQMAQRIAKSQSRSEGSIRAGSTSGGVSTRDSSTSADDRDRVSREASTIGATHGEQVKITGRLIERGGLQAIAVQKVEPKSGSFSSYPSSQ